MAGGHGSLPLIGTPGMIVDEMVKFARAGLAGITVSFFDFRAELPFFLERVAPLLEQAGLRTPNNDTPIGRRASCG